MLIPLFIKVSDLKDSLSPDAQPPMDFADDEPETLAVHYDQLSKVILSSI